MDVPPLGLWTLCSKKACDNFFSTKTLILNYNLYLCTHIAINTMIDERKVLLHTAEMAEHANGAAQYLEALLGGRFVTREQTRDMVDYLFAGTRRNIESCPFATQDDKDAEIHRRELLLNALKPLMGL